MIEHDGSLDFIAREKCEKGCRQQLKNMADHVVDSQWLALETIQDMWQFGYMKPGLCLTLVSINQAILYFEKPLYEVRKLVEGLVPVPKKDVVGKILEKMALVRINRIMSEINLSNKNLATEKKPLLPIPEITDKGRLHAAVRILRDGPLWSTEKVVKDVDKFLTEKKNLTDAHVQAAWNEYVTRLVMKQ